MGKSEYKKILEEKKVAKANTYSTLDIETVQKDPLLVVFKPESGLSQDQFYQLLEGLLILPGHVMVVSDDERSDADMHVAGKVSWVSAKDGRDSEIIDKYLLAADMALIFDEHMNEVNPLLDKGVVVIGYEKSPLLENYHPNDETGNSFTFASMNPWDIFRALVRASETFMFPYDWQNIVRSILKKK